MTARRSTRVATMILGAAFGGGLLASAAPAQDNDSARLQAIIACGSIDKKSARLSCYDALVHGAPAPRAAAPVATGAVAAAEPAPPPRASFGKEEVRRTKVERKKDVTQIIARTVSAVDDGIGHYTITLDDGARWQMAEAQPNFVPPRAGDTVRIRKASLGSYLMDVNYQASVRVTRIQ